MSQRFSDNLTLGAAAATNLLALMVTAGYTGSPFATELFLSVSADTRIGVDNTVSASKGRLLTSAAPCTEQSGGPNDSIDLKQIWLYSTPGATLQVSARAR